MDQLHTPGIFKDMLVSFISLFSKTEPFPAFLDNSGNGNPNRSVDFAFEQAGIKQRE